MVFIPKTWQNAPNTSTPLNAAGLIDLETRVSNTFIEAASSSANANALLRGRIATQQSGSYTNGSYILFASATVQTNRTSYVSINAWISDIRLYYGNWWAGANNGPEAVNATDISITAAIEYNGVSYPVYFPGTGVSITLAPGQIVETPPLGITLPPNSLFAIRTCVTLPSSSDILPGLQYQSGQNDPTNDGCTIGSNTTSSTGAMTSVGQWPLYGPTAITGRPLTSQPPQVVILGDSIALGHVGGDGYIDEGLGGGFGTLNLGTPAAHGTGYLASPAFRGAMIDGADYVIDQYGVNDLLGASPISLADLQASAIMRWLTVNQRAATVYAATITPYTSSTDSWTTLANQTIAFLGSGSTTRISYNTWLRQNAPILAGTPPTATTNGHAGAIYAGQTGHPLQGVFDAAALAESTLNSGLWIVGYMDSTGGGIHPTATGTTALSACINTSLLV